MNNQKDQHRREADSERDLQRPTCVGRGAGRRPERKSLKALRSPAWSMAEAPCREGSGSEQST